MKNLIITLILILTVTFTFAQQAVRKEIEQIQRSGASFSKSSLFTFVTSDINRGKQPLEGLKKGIILILDQEGISKLLESKDDLVNLAIPTSSRTNISLLLKKNEIVTSDFKLFASSDPTKPVEYTPGLHYKGIIEGDPFSLVGLSVYRNQVMAFISGNHGNLEIKLIPGDEDFRHVLFNVEDMDQPVNFECSGPVDTLDYTSDQVLQSPSSRDLNDCVRLYIELDDELVAARGGAILATDFMMGVLNQSIVVFANEQINMVVSEMLAWDVSSPYSSTSSSLMMQSFMNNTGFYNGDLAMLVNYTNFTTHSYGSLAGLCNPNPDLSKCAGPLNQTSEFSNVVTTCHYFGHLLGSRHTHECIWNGNNTSIDACFYEGGISPCPGPYPAYPPNGGTMMSFCSPGHGWFYNLAEGFGPQPGDIIRNTVNQAGNCILPCGPLPLYCFSNGANAASKFIKKVVLGSISNESGLNYGYGNYISLNTTLNAGTAYSISLTPGHASQTKYWRVWIDYNHDEDWNDSGEQVGQGSAQGSGAVTINFTVPSTSPAVSTRMRVSMSYGTFPPLCGEFNEGEVEDYTVNIISNAETCTDGIQNQNETGIDCGGTCPACPTCFDNIQNQGETGIDCGFPCDSCPSGGSVTLLATYFELGWDSWIDGGADANRVSSANSFEGQYSIRLADNSGIQSSMTSPVFNLFDAIGLEISFHYYPTSMEVGEDFLVQYKDGSNTWVTIGSYVSGTHFTNNSSHSVTIAVPNFVPTPAGSFRIQCDASDNNDQVFIDAVIITKLNGTQALEPNMNVPVVEIPSMYHVTNEEDKVIELYPNPSNGILNISFPGDIQGIRVINMEGKELQIREMNAARSMIDISDLPKGIYFLSLWNNGTWRMKKFIRT